MAANNSICGYCGQTDHRICYPTYDIFGNNYNICHCNTCKAYFLSPRPNKELLAKAYSADYYGESEEKFEGLYEKAMDYFRKRRAKRLGKYLGHKASVLDIGCGNGKFLKKLLKYGDYNLNGIELEGNAAKRASLIPEINLKVGFIEENDFAPESIDAVTMFQVFEHLTEPKKTLKIIQQILKKNGILVMSFPNISSFQAKLFKGRWLHLDPPRHLFYFDPVDLKELMKEQGYIHIRSRYTCTEQNPFGMVQSLLNLLLKKREILFEKMKGNKNYTKEYGPINIFMQKIFFFVTFPFFIVLDMIMGLFKRGATVEMFFKKL